MNALQLSIVEISTLKAKLTALSAFAKDAKELREVEHLIAQVEKVEDQATLIHEGFTEV